MLDAARRWEIENGEKFRHECLIVLGEKAEKFRALAVEKPARAAACVAAAEAFDRLIAAARAETRASYWKMLVQSLSNIGSTNTHDYLPETFRD